MHRVAARGPKSLEADGEQRDEDRNDTRCNEYLTS